MHPTFTKGLVKLCQEFMELKNWPIEQQKETNTYLEFLSKRAHGKIPTGARFIRNFVLNHPAYKQDSVVNNEIAFDLLSMIDSLESEDELSSASR